MTQSDQTNSPPTIVSAIRERTIGEKHAYLDGYKAGIRRMIELDAADPAELARLAEVWLGTADDIRESFVSMR